LCNLSVSLLRFNLFQQTIFTIQLIANRLKPGYCLCHLYLVLAESYWFIGDIRQAILFNKESVDIADEFSFLNLKIRSLIHLGLAKEDIWEVEEAIQIYNQAILLAESIKERKLLSQAKYWYPLNKYG
jgi:tetratricopeptide (TPR) repeat protein